MTTFEKTVLWLAVLAVGITGTAYAWMKYVLTTNDPYAVIHHPWQPAALKAHILAAPVLVFAAGLIFSRHVVSRWVGRRREGRRSGAMLAVSLGPMVVSGYALQTLTAEALLRGTAWIHLATGFLFLLGLAVHQTVAFVRERGAVRSRPVPGRRRPTASPR